MGESSPRFRIRFEDGSELPVGSVDGLSRRLKRGDVLPDTELFDAGTGEWSVAATSPIVRFILDELVRDGYLLPEEWADPAGTGLATPVGEPEDADVVSEPPSEDPVDPLDLKLTVPPEVDEGMGLRATPSSESSVEPPETEESPSQHSRHGRWVTPPSEGGLLGGASAAPPSGAAVRGAAPVAEAQSTPKAREALRKSGRPTWGMTRTVGVAAAVAIVGLVAVWGVTRPDVDTSQPPVLDVAGDVDVPPGLEEVADDAAARLSGRMLAVADSMRAVHELGRTPPESWLTGPYLAGAEAYPEVRLYWERYQSFLEDLRSIDDEQIRAHLVDAGAAAPSARRGELDAYLAARHQAASALRSELFDQLGSAAAEALDLHDFLVAETALLRYTPALGVNEVPRDPVLEVTSDSARVLEALGTRLDALFQALDRSRGGGAPAMSGLGNDLFRGFGLF